MSVVRVIVVDNVVSAGAILHADEGKSDHDISSAKGVLRMNEFLEDMRKKGKVEMTTIQTVGRKGWDGFTMITMPCTESAGPVTCYLPHTAKETSCESA